MYLFREFLTRKRYRKSERSRRYKRGIRQIEAKRIEN